MKITVNLATMPARVGMMRKAIKSIYPQVDELRIYLNKFKKVPSFLRGDNKITYIFRGKDLGDSGKFYWCSEPDEYYFSIDDDFIYPETYVQDHLASLREYGDEAIVTLHGYRLIFPFAWFRRDRELFQFDRHIEQDAFTHVGGTGLMVFNTNVFRVDYRRFLYRNMADLWVAKFAQQARIPIVVRKHKYDYLQCLEARWTIWKQTNKTNRVMCRLINSVENWKVYDKTKALDKNLLSSEVRDPPDGAFPRKKFFL